MFLAINAGISFVLRGAQSLWPGGPFQTLPVFLLVVGVILALNFIRAFAARRARGAYAIIAVLNVLTTVGIGNSSFLTSIGAIYRVMSSMV